MYFSLPIVVSLLVSSVSALATPHGPHARDTSLAARRHHIPRRANSHPLSRRSARRKRCLQRTTLPASSSSSSSPAVTTSNDPVLDVPVNVAHAPPTTTPTTQAPVQPTTTTPDYAPPQQPTNPTSPPSTGGGNGETHSGDGTFFDVGLGACGKTSANTDYMVAIGWQLFDSFSNGDPNPNHNPVCGRQIRATFGGKSVTVVVLDRCGGCQPDDLDFSPSAFDQLANPDAGRLHNVQWQFV